MAFTNTFGIENFVRYVIVVEMFYQQMIHETVLDKSTGVDDLHTKAGRLASILSKEGTTNLQDVIEYTKTHYKVAEYTIQSKIDDFKAVLRDRQQVH